MISQILHCCHVADQSMRYRGLVGCADPSQVEGTRLTKREMPVNQSVVREICASALPVPIRVVQMPSALRTAG